MQITGTVQFRLGHPEDGPLLSCSVPDAAPAAPAGAGPAPATHAATALWPGHPAADRQPTGITQVLDRTLRIGRADDNDVVIRDLQVSRRHAELRRLGGGRFQLTDTGSSNGTFVNGQRITTEVVTEADVIGIGAATFRLAGDELREFDAADGVLLDARGLTVTCRAGRCCSTTSPSRCRNTACSASSARAAPASRPCSARSPGCAPRPAAACCTTAATCTPTTPSCGTASAWSRRRTSCTPSSRPAAACPTPPSCGSPRTPAPPNAPVASMRSWASCPWPGMPTPAPAASPAASKSASTWHSNCSPSQACCSSTSPPPASTPDLTSRSWKCWPTSPRTAARSWW